MPNQLAKILDVRPTVPMVLDDHALKECITACFECSVICGVCADACLAENNVVNLLRCIRMNLDCQDICSSTARSLSRHNQGNLELHRNLLVACLSALRTCAIECENRAQHHEHCRVCAESCRKCEAACEKLINLWLNRAADHSDQPRLVL
jgi:hypothetical protein